MAYLLTEAPFFYNSENICRRFLNNKNSVEFIFETFGDSPEFKIFVSNMTSNSTSATFLISFGCDVFSKYANIQYDSKEVLNDLQIYFNEKVQ